MAKKCITNKGLKTEPLTVPELMLLVTVFHKIVVGIKDKDAVEFSVSLSLPDQLRARALLRYFETRLRCS